MLKTFIAVLLILPHFAIFLAAGIYEYKRWREVDPEIRPSFAQFLSRTTPAPAQDPARRAEKPRDTETETNKT